MNLSRTFFSVFLLLPLFVVSQEFYRVGSPDDIETEPLFGVLLAGGATDNDDGMKWLAQRANGGDVVVLREDNSEGYNQYILEELEVEINSVTTLVIQSQEQANNTEVCEAVNNAEMVFIAGGDQWKYYSYWKETCLQTALNNHVNEKGGAIGGTSAGLAILGEVVFTAENNSVWTEEALNNPYHFRVKLANDFLQIPFMESLVTDSHYNKIYGDDNNRHGRHMAFMARMATDWQMNARGVGVNEYTAVAVDENGIARVYGNPSYNDYAYFHIAIAAPEVCEDGQPLQWSNDQNAVAVYRVKGNHDGSNTFDISNWQQGSGGEWFRWYVEDGVLFEQEGEPVNTDFIDFDTESSRINTFPNPFTDQFWVQSKTGLPVLSYAIFSATGRQVKYERINNSEFQINTGTLKPGIYLLQLQLEESIIPLKIVRR